jgi:hypothetical protein
MRQHIVQDSTTAEYAGGLESVWGQWEPSLRDVERLLHAGAARYDAPGDGVAELLRKAQYRAHTASEFASGLRPPLAAVDAHEFLTTALDNCRDTLGVLAVRAELDELDEHTAEIGLGTVSATREAFQSARHSSAAAYRFTTDMQPIYTQPVPVKRSGSAVNVLLWALVATCALLFTVLLFEVFLLTPVN